MPRGGRKAHSPRVPAVWSVPSSTPEVQGREGWHETKSERGGEVLMAWASGSRAIPHERYALSEVQSFAPCLVPGITYR
jgi:hypothetical protein